MLIWRFVLAPKYNDITWYLPATNLTLTVLALGSHEQRRVSRPPYALDAPACVEFLRNARS
jgi:hypothetical protein